MSLCRYGPTHYIHRFSGNGWVPDVSLGGEDGSRFEKLFGSISRSDPLKYASLQEAYTHVSQPVPKIPEEKLNREVGSEENYYNAFLLTHKLTETAVQILMLAISFADLSVPYP
jgi:hypothetical protein